MPSDDKEHFVLKKEEQLKDASGFVVYRFYDRSSVAAYRSSRSAAASSAHVMKMKGRIGSDVNVSVARSFDMQYAMEAEFHRR